MAISTKVITMRQGNKADYQASKMLAGELAVINDTEELHFSPKSGKSIRVATENDLKELESKIPSGGGTFSGSAKDVTYDDSKTQLGATNVQDAIGKVSEQIGDVGKPTDEQVKNAVNDYLEENPVSFTESDPTVPDWAKQKTKPTYTADEVGALPKSTEIPTALPTPNKLTFSGAVTAEFDGSEAVNVEIPESAGGNRTAKTTKLLDVTFSENTAQVMVTLDHNYHRLFLVWNGSETGRLVDESGNAVAGDLFILLGTAITTWNDRKVGMISNTTSAWQNHSITMEWTHDLSTFLHATVRELKTSSKGYIEEFFGGVSAMKGTLGTVQAIAPTQNTELYILPSTGQFSIGSRLVLIGEYFD